LKQSSWVQFFIRTIL